MRIASEPLVAPAVEEQRLTFAVARVLDVPQEQRVVAAPVRPNDARDEMGETYGERPRVKLGFNLFAGHFEGGQIVEDLKKIFGGSKIAFEQIVIEVTDDGPGIASELRSTLFDRFTKSSGSRGSGLGLAIARAIVTAQGGTIGAAPPSESAS